MRIKSPSHFIIALFIFSILLCYPVMAQVKNEFSSECDEWISKVDPDITTIEKSSKEDYTSTLDKENTYVIIPDRTEGFLPDTTYTIDQVTTAIECLLGCKGNKNPAKISGVTHAYVSEILPSATVELAALFYISYLYKANYTHADGIALKDKDGNINPPGSLEKAYASYEKWFKEVKEVGLQKAREMELDPLEGSGLIWYGNNFSK